MPIQALDNRGVAKYLGSEIRRIGFRAIRSQPSSASRRPLCRVRADYIPGNSIHGTDPRKIKGGSNRRKDPCH
jgi:hypothetical protein